MNWGGPRPLLWSSILLLITVISEKMLKETETEETIGFLSHFCHWWHFNWEGGRAPCPPPLAYAYACSVIRWCFTTLNTMQIYWHMITLHCTINKNFFNHSIFCSPNLLDHIVALTQNATPALSKVFCLTGLLQQTIGFQEQRLGEDIKAPFSEKIMFVLHHTCCTIPKRISSFEGLYFRDVAPGQHSFSKKCCSGGESLAALSVMIGLWFEPQTSRSIWNESITACSSALYSPSICSLITTKSKPSWRVLIPGMVVMWTHIGVEVELFPRIKTREILVHPHGIAVWMSKKPFIVLRRSV